MLGFFEMLPYHRYMSSEKYTLVEGGILVEATLADNVDEPYQLFLDATAVSRANDQQERELRAGRFLRYLDESNIGSGRVEGQFSDLDIQIDFHLRGYGVYGMNANIVRPLLSDKEATHVATNAMRKMAYDMGTYPDNKIPSMVYASISREYGMTFETNPAGSSSMDTSGSEYKPTSERISLYAHNLYTHEMQLICISGLIALAKEGSTLATKEVLR